MNRFQTALKRFKVSDEEYKIWLAAKYTPIETTNILQKTHDRFASEGRAAVLKSNAGRVW